MMNNSKRFIAGVDISDKFQERGLRVYSLITSHKGMPLWHSEVFSLFTIRIANTIVEQLSSPHMVVLRDPTTNKLLNPVHRHRLITAYIQEPTPTNFFTVTNCAKPKMYKSIETQTGKQQSSLTEVRKSNRVRRKPIRFRDVDHVNPN